MNRYEANAELSRKQSVCRHAFKPMTMRLWWQKCTHCGLRVHQETARFYQHGYEQGREDERRLRYE